MFYYFYFLLCDYIFRIERLYIEGFLALGFADGCAEIAQRPDDRAVYFQNFGGFFVAS